MHNVNAGLNKIELGRRFPWPCNCSYEQYSQSVPLSMLEASHIRVTCDSCRTASAEVCGKRGLGPRFFDSGEAPHRSLHNPVENCLLEWVVRYDPGKQRARGYPTAFDTGGLRHDAWSSASTRPSAHVSKHGCLRQSAASASLGEQVGSRKGRVSVPFP
jgi:hypothetical protein